MGTSQQQKAQSRKAIVDAAAHLFRERGVDGVSVAQVMDAAGLTHGGFPRHFASKQELLNEALTDALASGDSFVPAGDILAFASQYLTKQHRDNPGHGCVYATLGTEIARGPAETRHVLSQMIQKQVDAFASGGKAHSTKAIGSWAAMIGGLILARVADNDELSEEILQATRDFVGV